MLRSYLAEKNLLYQATFELPTPEDVSAFEVDHISGPIVAEPLIDWRNVMTSTWNIELIYLMAVDFRKHLAKVTVVSLPGELMDEASIADDIESKLNERRRAYLDSLPPPLDSTETAPEKEKRIQEATASRRKKARRRSRKNNVSATMCAALTLPHQLSRPTNGAQTSSTAIFWKIPHCGQIFGRYSKVSEKMV
jgi:hypothetical protein